MRSSLGVSITIYLICVASAIAFTQTKSGVMSADELKHVVPASYFFAGQSAPVQIRNSSGFRTAANKMVLVGLVDTSGYASDIQQKYQGFFITETKVKVGDAEVMPGQYGFGFSKDGKFMLMDVSAAEIANTAASKDEQMARPVPLKIMPEGDGYKLYSGKNWVSIKPE